MLKYLILLALFVHTCLAFGLYQDVDDYELLRRNGPVEARTPDNDCRKDILIMWDNSQSIGFNHYRNIMKFLKELIKTLNVGPDGTHLGFLTFSSYSNTKKLLDVGQIQDPKQLSKKLDKYDYVWDLKGDKTHTGRAFEIANKMFAKKNPENDRDDVDDVILLFTDGRPEAEGTAEDTVNEVKKANKYANILKKQKNIKIVGVAAGKEDQIATFIGNLQEWATHPSLVVETGLQELKIKENVKNLVDNLVNPLCRPPPTTLPPTPTPTPTPVPGVCSCKGGGIEMTVFAKPGEPTTPVYWQQEELVTCTEGAYYERWRFDMMPGVRLAPRKEEYKIAHRYWYMSGGKLKDFKCFVNVTVRVCDCPGNRKMEAGRLSGAEKEAYVSWSEPEPLCHVRPNGNNPTKHNGMFTAGQHTVMYKYRVQNKFDLECPVTIFVPGEFCGDTAYDRATHDCCCGTVYKKNSAKHCCGDKYINPSAKMCCQGNRPVKRPGPC